MVPYYQSLTLDATIMVSKNCPIISALGAYISKTARWNFYILLTFDKHNKTQLLAKLQKILYMGFRDTLMFENLRWLWTPCTEFFITLPKVAFTAPFLKYKRLKLKLRAFLAGHSVAMVTYCVTKMTPTCSPVIGQFFDNMIVASRDNEW